MRPYFALMAIAVFVFPLVAAAAGDHPGADNPAPADKSKPVVKPSCTSVLLGSGERRCIVPGTGRNVWFKDCEHCPEMVVLPVGDAKLGPGPGEPGLSLNAELHVTSPFAIGRYAVTFAEWDACVGAGGCNGHIPSDQGWGRGDLPVINVNWSDAQAYVQWLSRMTGRPYRLPSEAEREYATRAGTTTRYWWGNAITLEDANIDLPIPARSRSRSQKVKSETAKIRYRTVPVGSFRPNPWGLYNVHGNVWEWTTDCLKEGSAALKTSTTPDTDKTCSPRISRGGSWLDYAREARSAARIGFAPNSRNRAQGFRVVRELPKQP